MFYRKTCSKSYLKDIRNPSKMRPFNFEKKIIQGAYWVFTKKFKYSPRIFLGNFEKHGFYTNEIKQKSGHFVQQLRCYNRSNWTYKFNKSLFFFLIFSPLLPVLPSASFSPLPYFVRNFFELPGHVCYCFIHVNSISSLKAEAIS